jgi:hypothetical protein
VKAKKVVHNVVFQPYVPFIIGDMEGHDRLLCGHYIERFAKIKQLFLACECPTEMTSYPKSVFRHRKPAHVGGLVNVGDVDSLLALSQSNIINGFFKICIGQHYANLHNWRHRRSQSPSLWALNFTICKNQTIMPCL